MAVLMDGIATDHADCGASYLNVEKVSSLESYNICLLVIVGINCIWKTLKVMFPHTYNKGFKYQYDQ